jgi:hypothetical protein
MFDDPRRARSFFEALVQDNIGIGRPEEVSLVLARQLRRPTQHRYQTRIFTTGTEIRIDFRCKHSRVKQYLKDGRALRIETVINRPDDLDVKRRLEHLPELIDKARQVHQRLLMIEQAGQRCAIGSALFERIHQPYHQEGQRTGALRFGDPSLSTSASAVYGSTGSSHASPARTPTSSPPTGSASPSSTQSSATGSYDRYSTRTNHPRKSRSDKPSEHSRPLSRTTSTPPDPHQQNRTRHNVTTSGPQVELSGCPARYDRPPSGRSSREVALDRSYFPIKRDQCQALRTTLTPASCARSSCTWFRPSARISRTEAMFVNRAARGEPSVVSWRLRGGTHARGRDLLLWLPAREARRPTSGRTVG